MDKVHHIIDRQFNNGFAQFEYSAVNGPRLGGVCTAKKSTNGA